MDHFANALFAAQYFHEEPSAVSISLCTNILAERISLLKIQKERRRRKRVNSPQSRKVFSVFIFSIFALKTS